VVRAAHHPALNTQGNFPHIALTSPAIRLITWSSSTCSTTSTIQWPICFISASLKRAWWPRAAHPHAGRVHCGALVAGTMLALSVMCARSSAGLGDLPGSVLVAQVGQHQVVIVPPVTTFTSRLMSVSASACAS